MLGLSGQPAYSSTFSNTIPCDDIRRDDSRSTTVLNQLLIPIEDHRPVIERIHAALEADGHPIGHFGVFPHGGAAVPAYSADGFIDISVSLGQAPAMALIIVGRCYRHP
jgi:hypothetical protein